MYVDPCVDSPTPPLCAYQHPDVVYYPVHAPALHRLHGDPHADGETCCTDGATPCADGVIPRADGATPCKDSVTPPPLCAHQHPDVVSTTNTETPVRMVRRLGQVRYLGAPSL